MEEAELRRLGERAWFPGEALATTGRLSGGEMEDFCCRGVSRVADDDRVGVDCRGLGADEHAEEMSSTAGTISLRIKSREKKKRRRCWWIPNGIQQLTVGPAHRPKDASIDEHDAALVNLETKNIGGRRRSQIVR